MRSVGNTGDCAVVLNADTGVVLAEVIYSCFYRHDPYSSSFPPGWGREPSGRIVCCCSSIPPVCPAWQQRRKWAHLYIYFPLSVRALPYHHIPSIFSPIEWKQSLRKLNIFVLNLRRVPSFLLINRRLDERSKLPLENVPGLINFVHSPQQYLIWSIMRSHPYQVHSWSWTVFSLCCTDVETGKDLPNVATVLCSAYCSLNLSSYYPG